MYVIKRWPLVTINHNTNKEENPEDRCECEIKYSIPFLDTLCSIKNGRIDTDLFKKPTDRNQYLLPSSCHPKQTTSAIPKSLGLRIVRVCSNTKNRDIRLEEMKSQLLDRGYSEKLLDSAIEKVKKIPRSVALKKIKNKGNKEACLCCYLWSQTSLHLEPTGKTLEINGRAKQIPEGGVPKPSTYCL